MNLRNVLVVGVIVGLILGLMAEYAIAVDKRINDLEAQVTTLQGQINEKDGKISELWSQIDEKDTQIITLQSQVVELKFQAEESQDELALLTDLTSQLEMLQASQVTEIRRKIAELGTSIADFSSQISEFSETVSSLESELSNIKVEIEKDKAFRIFAGYMIDSGSNLAVAVASHVVDEMDRQGRIPTIWGYGEEEIKDSLRSLISGLLRSIIPSSAWTERSASRYSSRVYRTSLKTAFPINVNVFGVDVNLARVVVVSSAQVDIETGSTSNVRITSVTI